MAGSYIGTAPATRDPEVSNDSVGTSKIIDDAVTAAKVAYIDDSLATTSGNIMVADGSDFGNVAMSGDATISSAGAVTIANDAVETVMILDDNEYQEASYLIFAPYHSSLNCDWGSVPGGDPESEEFLEWVMSADWDEFTSRCYWNTFEFLKPGNIFGWEYYDNFDASYTILF